MVLDHYTFKWRDGRMALALGLGSLFNHSETPNISYTFDTSTESIRYTAAKIIQQNEEMCIFYGHNLWFAPVASSQRPQIAEETPDAWGGLATVADIMEDSLPEYTFFLDGDPDEIIPVDDLPFKRIKIIRDDDEEELSAIRTGTPSYVLLPSPHNQIYQ
jgi:tRNA-specific adenosine deaminase 3